MNATLANAARIGNLEMRTYKGSKEVGQLILHGDSDLYGNAANPRPCLSLIQDPSKENEAAVYISDTLRRLRAYLAAGAYIKSMKLTDWTSTDRIEVIATLSNGEDAQFFCQKP
jgi:hypothetical protein